MSTTRGTVVEWLECLLREVLLWSGSSVYYERYCGGVVRVSTTRGTVVEWLECLLREVLWWSG